MKTNQFTAAARTAILAAAVGVVTASAVAQPTTSAQPAPSMPMPSASMAKPNMDMKQGMGTGMNMDMKPMMTDMHNQMMGMKSSGDVDVDFAMMMKMHHQGAIVMAEAQLKNGRDGQMRTMAKNIIRDQKKEIAVFDKFLAKKGESGMKMDGPAMQMNK